MENSRCVHELVTGGVEQQILARRRGFVMTELKPQIACPAQNPEAQAH